MLALACRDDYLLTLIGTGEPPAPGLVNQESDSENGCAHCHAHAQGGFGIMQLHKVQGRHKFGLLEPPI